MSVNSARLGREPGCAPSVSSVTTPPLSTPKTEAVQALIDYIRSQMLPRLSSRRDLASRHYSGAALIRMVRLVTAMIVLRSEGFPDVIGLPLRTVLECWWLGMYFALAPEEAYMAAHGDHGFQLGRLDPTRWGDTKAVLSQLRVPPKQELNWKRIAKRVGELYVAHGTTTGPESSMALYETVYRGESMMSVHGGLMNIEGHFDDAHATRFDLREIRPEPDDGEIRIALAAGLVETLARAVAAQFGLSYAQLGQLGDAIGAAGSASS
jgi:hypothetical protein